MVAGSGRELELLGWLEVAGHCSFGLHVLATWGWTWQSGRHRGGHGGRSCLRETKLNSGGAEPFVPSTGLLDTRAGPLPPARNGSGGSRLGGGGGGQAHVEINAFVDGPVLTFIVDNETALSVNVYPQLPRVAL